MKPGHNVTIVVPAKNEEAAIIATLDSLPLDTMARMGYEAEVVVLDGNSKDATNRLARQWGARVIKDAGIGKGRALRQARKRLRGDMVIMLDADGTYAADAIPLVIDRLRDGDVVMGRRSPQPGAMSGLHRLGNRILSAQASALYGRVCRDVCTGLWGFRSDILAALPLQSEGFELEAEIFSLSCRLGFRIDEISVDYLPRRGEAKLSAMRDGWRIASCLIRCRVLDVSDDRPLPQSAIIDKEGRA